MLLIEHHPYNCVFVEGARDGYLPLAEIAWVLPAHAEPIKAQDPPTSNTRSSPFDLIEVRTSKEGTEVVCLMNIPRGPIGETLLAHIFEKFGKQTDVNVSFMLLTEDQSNLPIRELAKYKPR